MDNFNQVMRPFGRPMMQGAPGSPMPMPPTAVPGVPGAVPPMPGMDNQQNAMQAWRGLRPDHQAFTGSHDDWQTQMSGWRDQRPDRHEMMQPGGVPTGVPGVPGAVPPAPTMMQSIMNAFNGGGLLNQHKLYSMIGG